MEIFVSCKFFAHYFRAALYFLLPAGSTGNCKISDLFEKFVFWS